MSRHPDSSPAACADAAGGANGLTRADTLFGSSNYQRQSLLTPSGVRAGYRFKASPTASSIVGIDPITSRPSYDYTPIIVDAVDPGQDGDSRMSAPVVITIPPSWQAGSTNVAMRVKDPGIQTARNFGDPSYAFSFALGMAATSDYSPLDRLVSAVGTPTGSGDTLNATVPIARTGSSAATPGFARVYYGSSTYTNITGFRWADLVRVTPDVIATGARTTIRIEGEFLDDSFAASQFDPKGDYVHFLSGGNDITRTAAAYDASADPSTTAGQISIVSQRLVTDGGAAATKQAIELTIEIGSGVVATLCDIDVKCGAVHAYSDSLSAVYAGANGAHRMNAALALLEMDFVTPDANGSPAASDLVSTSDPTPMIELDEPDVAYASIEGDSLLLSLTGTVYDPLVDNAKQGGGNDLSSVSVYSDESVIASAPLSRDANYESTSTSFWRQHPYRSSFSLSGIRCSLANGNKTTLTVRTAPNAVGLSGSAFVSIIADWHDLPGIVATSPGQLQLDIAYVLHRLAPDRLALTRTQSGIIETSEVSSQPASPSLYTGVMSGAAVAVTVIAEEPDVSINANLAYYVTGSAQTANFMVFAGRRDGTQTYDAQQNLSWTQPLNPGEHVRVRAVESIHANPPSVLSSYNPFTLRARAPSGVSVSSVSLCGVDQPMAAKDDGYLYPKGPSRRMFAVMKRAESYFIVFFDEDSHLAQDPLPAGRLAIDNGTLNFRQIQFRLTANGKPDPIFKDAVQMDFQPFIKNMAIKLVTAMEQKVGEDIIKYYDTCYWLRSLAPAVARILPDYSYAFPGSYLEDVKLLNWLKMHYDAGDLDRVRTTGFLKGASVSDGYEARDATLGDMKGLVKHLAKTVLPLATSMASYKVNNISGDKIYDSFVGQLITTRDLLEYLWYISFQPTITSACTWAQVPSSCVVANILTESREDTPLKVIAEDPVINNPLGGAVVQRVIRGAPADGRATGTGVCNLNFILPLEDQTGIPIRSVLRRVGCPDPDLSGEWSASTDREYFLNTIQRNPTKSIIVQAALWRAAAEALANGNPARFTNEHLTNITAADWSKRVIDVGADKISFANFIMMAYEQAATGFLADGTYLANKVDLRTATYNDSADVRTNLQRLNTEGSYSFTTASFNAVLPDAGLYEQMFQAMSK